MRRLACLVLVTAVLLAGALVQAQEKAPEKIKLGRQKVGTYTVSAILVGDPHDQPSVELDVKLYDAEASKTPPPDPKAIRAWIGDDKAKDEDKVTLDKKKATFGATLNVPKPLADSAKLWVEIETDAGTTRGSFSLEHDHKH